MIAELAIADGGFMRDTMRMGDYSPSVKAASWPKRKGCAAEQ